MRLYLEIPQNLGYSQTKEGTPGVQVNRPRESGPLRRFGLNESSIESSVASADQTREVDSPRPSSSPYQGIRQADLMLGMRTY